MKATRGPWVVVGDEFDEDGYSIAGGPNQEQIASIEPSYNDGEELANARLMAAALELRSVLTDVVARIGKTPVRMDLTEAHALLKHLEGL